MSGYTSMFSSEYIAFHSQDKHNHAMFYIPLHPPFLEIIRALDA